jgi:hypothetical protein
VAHQMVDGVWHLHQLALRQICKAKTELDLPATHGTSHLHCVLLSTRKSARVASDWCRRGTAESTWFCVVTFALTVIAIRVIQGVEKKNCIT